MVFAIWAQVTALNILLLPSRYMQRVGVVAAKSGPLLLMVRAPGVLKPTSNAVFKAEFDGPVVRKLYSEGQHVSAGDLLLEIGRENIQAQHMGKVNELRNAERDVDKTINDLALQKALFHKGAVARAAVADAQRDSERARQQLEVSSAAFRLEEQHWNANLFRAPFDGTITKDSVGQDKVVAAGKELFSLGSLASYSMETRVDELDIAKIKEGQPAMVYLQAYEDVPLVAKVVKIGVHSEEKGFSEYSVMLMLIKTAGLPILPQFTGDAEIMVGKTEPVVSIPLSAVVTEDGKNSVWLVKSFQRIWAQPVEVGRSNPNRVEITQGLSAGDRVCLSPQPFFKNGMQIEPNE